MSDLRRHVPPVALAWDAESPGSLWRAVDGTLVFADVSGFTALTERLSRRGRIGAEQVVETLNGVFGPMLELSAARGGEMLKFGGDALFFLFRGPDHAVRACDATAEMQGSLRTAASRVGDGGRLSLSMSVGMHSGEVHLFLVGSPTRELLVLGPAASATADAEKTAEAGEVVLTPATAALLPRDAVRTRDDGVLLLRRRRPARSGSDSPAPLPASDDLLRGLFPRTLGEYLSPGPPEPEHRLATIAFVRFSGTDALLASAGPAALATTLDALVTGVEEALATEGVTLLATDLDRDGGKFFLGSGVPVSREDDEGRMLRALRRVLDADLPLPVQVGVNRGHVFVAEVGVDRRAAYSAMGDTTNTAARITAAAPAGRLYSHPGVLDHARTRFATRPRGPFPMKGKAAPVLVLEVGDETGTREVQEERRLPFVGRESERRLAAGVVTEALGGAGGVLVVEGGTGLGKSRLVHEVLAAAGRADRLTLQAEPYGASSAYRVLRDPLRSLLGIERADPATMGGALVRAVQESAPDLLPLLPLLADVVQVPVPPTPEADLVDPQFRADRTADVVVDLLGRLVAGPLVVLVEEAHWADAASSSLLERLAAASTGRPWLVVAVRRPVEGGFSPATATHVVLDPMPAAALRRLVLAATAESPLRPHEVDAVVERAEGNPLFVEEVTRLARGEVSLESLPESLAAAMSRQIDELGPAARRVLRYTAVLGRSFRRAILDATLSADGLHVDPGTEDALSGLLVPDGPERMRFRSSLVRDAAYESLPYRVRARLHRTAGEVLEELSEDRDADAATMALHFDRAGDAVRTWEYARRAGHHARRRHANADAADHFSVALGVARRVPEVSGPDRAALWSVVGELRELAGEFEQAVEAQRQAARLLRDEPEGRARALVALATVQERTGAYPTALRTVARARALLPGMPGAEARRLAVRLDTLTALVRLGQNRPADARTWAERAAEGAREVEDHETRVRALMLLDFADLQTGAAGLGERHREALDICVEHGFRQRESVARANLGAFAYYAGRWTEAARWYDTSRTVALEAGNAFGAAETEVNLGELLINQGRLEEADRVLADAVRVLRASGAVTFLVLGELQRARLLVSRGELEEAARTAERVHEQARGLGQTTSAMEAALVRADAVSREGRAEEALALVATAERELRADAGFSLARICLQRARALLTLGRFEEADEMVLTGRQAARELGLPYEEALLLRLESRVARHQGDDERWRSSDAEAREMLEGLGVSV
ncbi:adenylate/guanylate cyclase domain-containing protein [Phycicoccus flavus]|uniref:AAA family ATPase n=1 Tax=Phycicoccus flavus TaxID=2502783 RepID=A0A8T6R2C8_9MICO|nr:adenylate/guanylate cyclase domain-containing protein [Phycicoccus flavus]NHA67640.1 AAA family ATPase [Phycicoccus flavus]